MHIHELMAKMTGIETTFRSKHGHAPSQAKLADLMGIPPEKLQMLLKVSALSGLQSAMQQCCFCGWKRVFYCQMLQCCSSHAS